VALAAVSVNQGVIYLLVNHRQAVHKKGYVNLPFRARDGGETKTKQDREAKQK
jgi:hypothetical protein